MITYYGVYRSDTRDSAEDGYGSVCVALFGDIPSALDEARVQLEQGYHVMIDCGAMSAEEWEALEEVPDDFVTTQPEAEARP